MADVTQDPVEPMPDLEMWGGVECTVVRIGDIFRNEVVETGYHERLDDLDRIAALGIRTLRHPIIWETVAPDQPEECDWRWHDTRLKRLNDLGIRVIAGLVHHGSGPRYTSLLDPAFPHLLAAHAANVARRYPWIELFTPVNEPLTTARLSGLYGHWYPHARDERSFLRALLYQCRAIALAMAAIRQVTPSAQLVQTEDVGKVFSTPQLSYQADFENERRWLSFDILSGRLGPDHPLYAFLLAHGLDAAELETFQRERCTPDIIGVNHYLTSERYLHVHRRAFPAEFAASNGRQCYADVEAVRMPVPRAEIGPQARLNEVWQRYRLPVAVTEVHHGCTREEQLRWLMEVWQAAVRLRARGADIRAVTSWSLFGAVDWNSLLTRWDSCYEPGAFDVRNSPPRLTAVGQAVRSLAMYGEFNHPVLIGSEGWWRRPGRFYRKKKLRCAERITDEPRPCLVFLVDDARWGRACAHAGRKRGLEYVIVEEADAIGADGLTTALVNRSAWAILDTRNVEAGCLPSPSTLLLTCERLGIPLAIVRDEHTSGPQACDPSSSRADGAEILKPALQKVEGGVGDRLVVCCGPAALDDVLDLLIDGERGVWKLASKNSSEQLMLQPPQAVLAN